MKILIVDDDDLIRDMYVLKFKGAGFTVATACDGKSAIETAANEKPDAALIDVILPHMDGFEILQELKKRGILENMRVIMLSNVGERKDIERGMRLGASDYLIKANFTPSQVVEKVKAILNAKRET